MKLKHITLLVVASLVLAACNNPQIPVQKEAQTPQKPLISYVDSFIGTGGHGHTYPGATTPFDTRTMAEPMPAMSSPRNGPATSRMIAVICFPT